MRRIGRSSVVQLSVLVVLAVPAGGQGAPLSLDDLSRFHALRSPAISPDGAKVLYVVGRQNFQENRTDLSLLELDVTTRATRVVVTGKAGLRDPQWAKDGAIVFVARADKAPAEAQLFHVARGGQPRQVTVAPRGVRAFALSPDGERVAYSMDDALPVRSGEERFNDSFEVGNDDFLTMSPPQPVHLWVQRLAGGAARRVTTGSWSLATSLSTSPLAWTRDARAIVATRYQSPHSGDTDKSRAVVIDVQDGTVRSLAETGARQDAPTLSRDGRWVAFGGPRDGVPANQREVMLVPATGGAVRNVSRPLDRAVSADWFADGSLLLDGTDGTRAALWRLPLEGQPRRLPLGDVVAISGTSIADDGTIAFVGSERARPEEIYLLGPSASAPTRLTDHHGWVTSRRVGTTRGLEWPSRDDLTADGVVTYPPGFDPSRTHPLVLLIHGGPTASSNEGWATRAQLMAARGWVVFQPNYRGSDNRGNAFQRAIADDPGPGIDADVMSGIAALVRLGGIDTTRIGVSGWSFGGYVSAWLIGHHQHWKGAVVGAGAMDLYDMYALTDLNVQLRHAITASPYVGGREEWFRAQSPLTYASRVRTPTLILHDVRDQRVTITQSFKLFHALKDNGVPVQFIAYPVAGHSPTDPVRARDVTRRWIDWFDRVFATPTP